MMNLEKMKQKKRTITKSRVKKSLLAATTFLCLTTPLLQTQTAYAAENTTPAITIEKPDGWKQGETTIAVTVDASHMPEGFSIAKIEAKAGKDGSWQDVTGSGSITITGNFSMWRMALPKSLFPTKNRHLSLCKRVNFSSSLQMNTTLLGPPPAILPFYLPQVFTVIPQIFHCSPTKSLYARKKRPSYYRHSPQKEKATFLQKSTQHRLLPSNEDITSLSAVNNLSAFTLKCSSSA